MMKSPIERFLDKIDVKESGCWEWQAGTVDGYGQFWVKHQKANIRRSEAALLN